MKNFYRLLSALLIATFSMGDLNAQVNISNGSTTVCLDSLYDTGGQTGPYGNNENFEFTISPTNAYSVTLDIDSINIGTGDTLRIYDGTSSTDPLIYEFNDTSVVIPSPLTSTGGDITVLFFSDGAVVDHGFKMHWSASYPTVDVSIVKSVTDICVGDNVLFTATPDSAGPSPDYQWYINGDMVGANQNTFDTTTLSDNDFVWVELDAVADGCNADSIGHDSLQVTVTSYVTASVSVAKSVTNVCVGDSVTFTASPTNGGAPDYQWYVNGGTVGTNSTTYKAPVNNNDWVKVQMAANGNNGCLIDSLSADSMQVTVTTNLVASVSISSSVTTICEGDMVTFTANPTNGGASPTLDWAINGTGVGSGTSIMTDTLSTGSQIKVDMASDENSGCLTDSLTADSIVVTINANDTASVSMSGLSAVCDGTNIMFTATPVNGGTPSYDWSINGGGSVGSGNTYSTSSLSDNDYVKVEMTSSISTGCLVDSISVDSIIVTIYPNPSVSIGSVSHVDCFGDSTGSGTANVVGGTGTILYTWTSGETTMVASSLWAATHQVNVIDDNLCVDSATQLITENPQIVQVFTVVDASSFGASDGSVKDSVYGGSPSWDHEWSNGVTATNQAVSQISGVAAGTYTDTIIDNLGCKVWASAVVDQPGVLLGGEIRIGGATSAPICAGDTVGAMTNQVAAAGGIGTTAYTWQYSTNLLTWSDYPSSNSDSYTLNDSITQITFVRRIIVDSINDTASSNILFLNYIADVAINIIGLDPTYCQSDALETLIGTPNSPGTGSFIATAYLTTGGDFSPSLAASSPGGTSNNIQYTYTDTYGCLSSASTTTTVYDTTNGSTDVPQVVFTTTDAAIQLYDTVYTNADPGGSGTWSGLGVYFSTGNWYFDPTLVVFAGSDTTVQIDYEFTNSSGCVSHESYNMTVTFNLISMKIQSNLSDFSSCATYSTDTIYAIIPSGETVIEHFFYFTGYGGAIYDPNFIADTLVDTIKYGFDPANHFPVVPYSGTWDTSTTTPVGVTTLQVRFYHRTISNPNWAYIIDTIEIVNLGNVTVTSNQLNSNGTNPTSYFHHCVDVPTNDIYTTYWDAGIRPMTWEISAASGSAGLISDNGDGTATLYPTQTTRFWNDETMSYDYDTIQFVYTDNQTGCSTTTQKDFYPTTLPTVTMTNLAATYCSNDGIIEIQGFQGTPYGSGSGSFTSSDDVGLDLNHNTSFDTAYFVAGPDAVGSHWIKYKFTDFRQCTDSTIEMFDVDTIPHIRVISVSGDEFCENDNTQHTMAGQVWNGSSWVGGSGFTGSVYGNGIIDSNVTISEGYFRPDSAGAGTAMVNYKYIHPGTGCHNIVDTAVDVLTLPDASFMANDTAMCMTESDWAWFTYTGGVPGTYDYYLVGHPGTITSFDPVDNPNITFGLNQVYNVFTESVSSVGCQNSDTINMYVDTFPIVDITSATGAYCYNGGAFSFTGNPASPGGLNPSYFNSPDLSYSDTLFSSGDSTRSFNPAVGDIGVNKIYYSYTDPSTGCFAKDSLDIEIYDIPTLSLQILVNPSAPSLQHCIGDTVEYEKIKNGSPDVSPFSYIIGNGFVDSTQNFFNSTVAGIGAHTITYKSLDSNNCYNETDTVITVIPTSNPSFSMSANVACVDPDDYIVLEPNATPTNYGGTFKFPDLGYEITNATTDTFYLGWLGDSTYSYTVRYVYDAGFGCIDSVDQTVLVNDTPKVTFTTLQPEYCANEGTVGIKVDAPSLGQSYFRSYTWPGFPLYNNLIDSSNLASGVDSVQFTLDTSYSLETIWVDYIHVDANGCEGIQDSAFFVNGVPQLEVYYDTNVCATTDTLFLLGEAGAYASTFYDGGWFTGSAYGELNGLVNSDTMSNGAYGAFPVNSFFTDTVYYHYLDPLTNCYNSIWRLVEVKQLPPPMFTIDNTGNPSPVNVCPDGEATFTTIYGTGTTTTDWPSVTQWWDINDSTIALIDEEFNPGPPGVDDSSNYNGWNYVTHTIWDNQYGCVDSYRDSVFLDSFPVVDVTFDSSLYCTNSGTVVFTGSPASPGASLPSVFSSTNINARFDTNGVATITNTGQDTIHINMDQVTKPTIGGYNTKNISYTYTEPATGCTSTSTKNFILKREPFITATKPGSTVFCPYESDKIITMQVDFQQPNISGTDSVLGGLGLLTTIAPNGDLTYRPRTFLGDTFPTYDTLVYFFVDTSNCTSTWSDTSFVVKNQPILQMTIPTFKDSVCFEEPAVTLEMEFYDIGQFNQFLPFGTLGGTSPASGDQSYFTFDGIPPSSGTNSYDFVAEFDSKNKTHGVSTEVNFIGTYRGNGCYDTITDVYIVTHPKPVAEFYLDGRCGKYKPVMHGDSSYIDTAGFSPSDAISRYEWTVDGDDSAHTWPAYMDTLVTYEHRHSQGFNKVEIDLKVVSKKGCESEVHTEEIQFLTSPDAIFEWSMGDECLGDSVEFRADTTHLSGFVNTIAFLWNFGDGDTTSKKTPVYNEFPVADTFSVSLVLTESGSSCQDTAIQDIYIRPVISNYPHTDDFESAYSGWVVWNDDTLNANGSFAHGVVNKAFLNDAGNGNLSWATDLDSNYSDNLITSVTSPCYDMTTLDRPMVKLLTTIYCRRQ